MRPSVLALLLGAGLLSNNLLVLAISGIAALLSLHAFALMLPLIHPIVVAATVLFGGITLLALTTPPATDYASTKLTTLLTATLVTALAASLLRNEQDVSTFAKVWVLAAVALSLVVIVMGVGGVGRTYILGINPIWLARVPASAIVITVWARVTHRLSTPLALSASGVLLLAVIITGSKGPLLAAVAGSLVLTLAISGLTMARVSASFAAMGAMYLVLAHGPLARTRIGQFAADPLAIQDEARETALSRSWLILKEHPLSGVGFGNWGAEAGIRSRLYPHNVWVELVTELGLIFGLAVCLWFVVIALRLWRQSRTHQASALVLGLLLCEIVNSSVSGDLNSRALWCYSLLGLWVSSRHFNAKDPDRSTRQARKAQRLRRPVRPRLQAR